MTLAVFFFFPNTLPGRNEKREKKKKGEKKRAPKREGLPYDFLCNFTRFFAKEGRGEEKRGGGGECPC